MTVDVQAMYGLWLREITRFLRSWSRVIGWLITPLLILGFLAVGFRGAALPGLPADVEYVQYLVPGMAGFTILFSASFSGLGILSDREVGFLKEILVAPVSRRAIVPGWTAGGATTAVIQSTLIILLSIPLGFRLKRVWMFPVAVLVLLLLAITFIGFGLELASQFRDSQGSGCSSTSPFSRCFSSRAHSIPSRICPGHCSILPSSIRSPMASMPFAEC